MTKPINLRKLVGAGLALLLSMALAACLVLPGKFTETLDLRKDGHFSYSYKGEILVLGLSKLADLAKMGGAGSEAKFTAEPCFGADSGEERPCTKAELAEQKQIWDDVQTAATDSKQKTDSAMQAMMGGIDPNDPKAGEELAERLRKQAGWNKVTYKGDGVYEVEFAISGQLDHDFSFPTLERMPVVIPFLTINRRADLSVRVSSPIMEQQSGGGAQAMGMGGFAAAMNARTGQGEDGVAKAPDFPQLDGTLTLTTDGTILANNTEDGPKADPAGQRLTWQLNVRNTAAPMALVQLGK